MAQWAYQFGGGFGVPDRETQADILSLFFKPLEINRTVIFSRWLRLKPSYWCRHI